MANPSLSVHPMASGQMAICPFVFVVRPHFSGTIAIFRRDDCHLSAGRLPSFGGTIAIFRRDDCHRPLHQIDFDGDGGGFGFGVAVGDGHGDAVDDGV